MVEINLIRAKNYEDFRKQIKGLKGKIVVEAKDDVFNRKILESGMADVIFNLELGDRKDKLKMRDSGLNQVLCRIAREKGVCIGIDFREIKKQEIVYLSRLMQNIRLCKKYRVKMVLMNCNREKFFVVSLLLSLGMTTSMIKFAFDNSFSLIR